MPTCSSGQLQLGRLVLVDFFVLPQLLSHQATNEGSGECGPVGDSSSLQVVDLFGAAGTEEK